MREDEGRPGADQPSRQAGETGVNLRAARALRAGEGEPHEGQRNAEREEQGIGLHEEAGLERE
jgi:hypothetical protein